MTGMKLWAAVGSSKAYAPDRPGHSIGVGAGVDVADDLERLHIDHRDITIRTAGFESAHAVGLNQDSAGTVSGAEPFDFVVRDGVQDDEIRSGGD